MTEGQRAYMAWIEETGSMAIDWSDIIPSSQAMWERIAAGKEAGPGGWRPAKTGAAPPPRESK